METEFELAFDYVMLLISLYQNFKVAVRKFSSQSKKRPKLAPLDLGSMFKLGSSSACLGGEMEVEAKGTDQLELVSIMALCTDSSVGFPQKLYTQHMKSDDWHFCGYLREQTVRTKP